MVESFDDWTTVQKCALVVGTLVFVWTAMQMVFSRMDAVLLSNCWIRGVKSGEHRYVTASTGARLAVRVTKPAMCESATSDAGFAIPVFIPNGLAATMLTIGALQDNLTKVGFTVVSFDRPGVGWSPPRHSWSASELEPEVGLAVTEIRDVMRATLPSATKWILLGPSMGSIVAQCFMAQHPDMVAGFVNLDGLPHSFANHREHFLKAAKMYKVMAWVAWMGIMRLPLLFASGFFGRFASSMGGASEIRAQMNRSQFYSNTFVEFHLMMDCAQVASDAWGAASVLKLSPNLVKSILRVEPKQNGTFDKSRGWTTLPRATSERGDGWLPAEEATHVKTTLREVIAAQPMPLTTLWSSLPVRVMSARSYDYAGGSWYTDEMRDLAAAEHSLHQLAGAEGSSRVVFPTLGHDKLFLEAECMVELAKEIHVAAALSVVAAAASK